MTMAMPMRARGTPTTRTNTPRAIMTIRAMAMATTIKGMCSLHND